MTTKGTASDMKNHLWTGSEDGRFTSFTNIIAKTLQRKTILSGTLTTRLLTILLNDPYQKALLLKPTSTTLTSTATHTNPQLYDKTTLTFKQQECTPFEEYIRKTGMNISSEPRYRSKTVQPIPDYNQDAEHVTEILVDFSQNNAKPILKNQGFYTTAPHSPPKDQPINPIRAGIIRSPTMDVAPDSHQHRNLTDRTTIEAVDLAPPTPNSETNIPKPKTKRIKRSLLLEPSVRYETQLSPTILNSQLEVEIDTDRHIIADATNMQSEFPSGAANGTPQQDVPRSYPPEQTAEYLRNNKSPVREINVPTSLSSRQTENEVEDPRPLNPAQLIHNLDPPPVL